MPYRTDRMTVAQCGLPDRRRKLTEEQKCEIRQSSGISLRKLAAQYGVDKRTIQFVLYPERLVAARANRNWRDFHDKAKFNKSVRIYRHYKRYGEVKA